MKKQMDLVNEFQKEIEKLYNLDKSKFYEIKDILEKMVQEQKQLENK